MSFPVTLNGRTYTIADFEGTNYVDGFPDALEDFVTQAGDIYNSTSSSSVTIGTGEKTFTTADSDKPYQAGTPLRIADAAAPETNFLDCIVTSYSSTTLVVDVFGFAGSGTISDWTINIGGAKTVDGTLPIDQGGTGATTASAAADNLGLGTGDDVEFSSLTVGGFTSTGIDDNASSTALTLDTSGNVGIGTNNPAAKLEVIGDINSVGNVGIGAIPGSIVGGLVGTTQKFVVDGTIGQVQIAQTGNEIAFSRNSANYISATGANGTLIFSAGDVLAFNNDGSESMRIDSSGNLLVGQTSSSLSTNGVEIESGGRYIGTTTTDIPIVINKLNSGTQNMIHFYVNTVNAGYIASVGGGTPSFVAASDVRLKNNIIEHESELDNVMVLRPVRWDWKDRSLGSGEGFIAQDLEQTAWADLVIEGEDGYKQVSGLGVVETRLIKAIQEQQEMIQELRARVAQLEANDAN